METVKKVSGGIVVFLVFFLAGPIAARAATAPDLGVATSYAIFGKAGVTNSGAPTHIWGNVGADAMVNITGLTAPQVDGTIIAPAAGVQTAITAAYGALDAQGATGSLDLAGTNIVTPGVYTVGATTLNGLLTLNGAGVYIFRSSSAISASPGAQMLLTNGAAPCNVFWEIADSFAIGTGAHIEGTIITNTSFISLGTNASLVGRAFSSVAQVTLLSNLVTQPTCTGAAAAAGGTRRDSTINVVKLVVNDNGGTKVVSDFPLFLNGASVVSGTTTNFPVPGGTYTVTETSDPNYTRTFSGDCDVNGQVTLNSGDNRFCIITNNDIGAPAAPVVPPLIDVVKVPSPLALPGGPGPVTYTYTARNIGTVPMSNVTMVGDTCSPIILVSGDTNGDSRLDVNETWVYTCSTTLTETHTNTVVATGWANGISATDIASATVIVGAPIVPPLIHVTKVPSPLALFAGGGMVTYTERITNPGTVPLSGVGLTDDKCSPLIYISGDANTDSLLDPSETWIFTCSTRLSQTTTNTATATGQANGITVRDFAIATVVVAAPGLPNAGFPPVVSAMMGWPLVAAVVLLVLLLLYVIRKQRTA